MTNMEFKQKCYELYQLDWLKTHGYSLRNVFDVLREGYHTLCEDGEIDGSTYCDDDVDLLEDYFDEHGFNGELFACEDEFLDAEYMDSEYMEYLLPADMYEFYQKEMEKENGYEC